MNATEQGNAVARNILGEAVPFDPIPFFWTDHYDVKIQVAGFIPPHGRGAIVEGDPDTGSFVKTFHEGGRFVGVLGWNGARGMTPYRRKLEAERASSR
jgi:NADPH-dependent 2,4-dienoyl-CoA reductase/sulfur reductase-like enzyme